MLGLAQISSEASLLLSEGVTLREKGRDTEALKRFEAAYRLSKSPRALAQIALAEQALGRWLPAYEHLTKALKNRSHPWVNKYRSILDGSLSTIRSRLGELEIECSIRRAVIRVNGRRVGVSPLRKPVLTVAGSVVVEVSAEGYWPIVRNLTVLPLGKARERFELIPQEELPSLKSKAEGVSSKPPVDATLAEVVEPPSGPRLLPYALASGGAALAAAGVGTAFIVIRNGHASDFNDDSRCLVGMRSRLENCGDSLRAAEDAERIATASFIGGGVLAATTLVLMILNHTLSPDDEPSGLANTWAGCGLELHRPGLACAVRF